MLNNIADYIGSRIRLYRKQKRLSIEELASSINKSKSTVSKYESGNIVTDIETLYDIADVLDIGINQLLYYKKNSENCLEELKGIFSNKHLYLYFYDGRKNKYTKGFIEIYDYISDNKKDSSLYLGVENWGDYLKCETLYYGQIESHDLVTNASYINQANCVERISLTSINPMTNTNEVSALLIGISGNPFIPVAIKCIISLNPLKEDEELNNRLMISKEDIKIIKKYNFFTNQRIL